MLIINIAKINLLFSKRLNLVMFSSITPYYILPKISTLPSPHFFVFNRLQT
ncbi:hypothetical protein KL86SPO_30299 [uncultured Sporomusa sp.]|uniref:Uncharacterized protein n=1 Tax=uncultured Sporomusa sp. TaxID=307249 RepID=A0A212LRL8_9FIRM|nr:hypothetical protein KL86SPO_30299 [uncultured Sporomusa sp.]